jgi:hypothetical protein
MKHYKYAIVGSFITSFLVSCAAPVPSVLQYTGANRAQGTVVLSLNSGVFGTPNIDWPASLEIANKACGTLGYTSAHNLPMASSRCLAYGQPPFESVCKSSVSAYSYQCAR